jgi:hypothetical protein
MKKAIYLIFILFANINFGQVQSINKAQQIYLENLKIINEFIANKGDINDGEIVDNSIDFLEEITKIKSDFIPAYEIIYTPSEQNLKDWKNWYKKNKKLLYWDEEENKVKVRKR